jgi:membrane protein required for colicin V production
VNALDYLIIAVMAISCVAGFLRGLLREVISLATWLLAVIIAWRFSDLITPYLVDAIASVALRTWSARGLLFIIVIVIGSATAAIVSHFVRLSIFSGLDRFLGLVFGALRAAVGLGLLAILFQTVKLDQASWYQHSSLMPYAERVSSFLRALGGDKTLGAI